jgi:hypothetical protein
MEHINNFFQHVKVPTKLISDNWGKSSNDSVTSPFRRGDYVQERQSRDPQQVQAFMALLNELSNSKLFVVESPLHFDTQQRVVVTSFNYDSQQLTSYVPPHQACSSGNACVGLTGKIPGHKTGFILKAYCLPDEKEEDIPESRCCLLCWRLVSNNYTDFINKCPINFKGGNNKFKGSRPLCVPLLGSGGYAENTINRPSNKTSVVWFNYPIIYHLPRMLKWVHQNGSWYVDQSALEYVPNPAPGVSSENGEYITIRRKNKGKKRKRVGSDTRKWNSQLFC